MNGPPPALGLVGELLDELLAHALSELPREAVGFVGGRPDGQGRRIVPLPNIAGERAFLADPYHQFRATRMLEADGLEPIAVYHSHPEGGVELSAQDVVFAARQRWIQLVLSIQRRDHGWSCRLGAWNVSAGRITRVEIITESDRVRQAIASGPGYLIDVRSESPVGG